MDARIGFVRERARKILKDTGQNSIPIDLKKICERLGFQYVEVDHFPDNLSALYVEQNGTKYAAVNRSHHSHRKRFSLAHEIGHWLFGHTRSYQWAEVSIDNPPDPNDLKCKSKTEETEADEFAGELLVPLLQLKRSMEKHMRIPDLVSFYNVSPEVVTIRLIAARFL